MRPSTFLPLFFLLNAVSARPQNLLSDIASAFGFGGDDDPTTTVPSKTLAPPATVSASATKTKNNASTQTSTVASTGTSSASSRSSPTSKSSSASTDSSSSTITSAPNSSSTSSSSSSSLPPSTTTSSSTPTSVFTAPSQTASPSSSSPSSSVPPGGIAVAVIFVLAAVAAAAYLLFRYHPGIRRWYLAREEKRMQERSYRDAIDGPFAGRGAGVHNDGQNDTFSNGRKSMLASFFAPRTVRLGDGKEIRRKPVNWGAGMGVPPSPSLKHRHDPMTPELPGHGVPMEKVALTNMAAPMARSESTKSSQSYISGSGGGGGGQWSNRSSPALTQKELPPMPPIPPMPAVPASPKRRDPHQILSRKSIFELA